MLTFIQFLIQEAQRTPKRAAQVLARIAKSKRFGGGEVEGAINSLAPQSGHKYGGGGYSPERLDPKRNKTFSPNTIAGTNFKYSHTEKIPLKSVRSAQDRVSVAGVLRQIHNPTQRHSNPKVFKVGDTHIVRDGHHGVAAARLRGDTHITADVFVKKDIPPGGHKRVAAPRHHGVTHPATRLYGKHHTSKRHQQS